MNLGRVPHHDSEGIRGDSKGTTLWGFCWWHHKFVGDILVWIFINCSSSVAHWISVCEFLSIYFFAGGASFLIDIGSNFTACCHVRLEKHHVYAAFAKWLWQGISTKINIQKINKTFACTAGCGSWLGVNGLFCLHYLVVLHLQSSLSPFFLPCNTSWF